MANGRTPAQVLFTIMIACGLWAGTASAQDVSRLCEGYARQAVQQNRQNAEFACGLSGPQWNSDYRYHYDWCVQGRNSESAARWNQWRDAQIAQCRTAKAKPPGAPSSVAQICEGYARQAVQQHQQNAEFACGLSGPQWNSDYRYHYDWCVQGRNSESAARWNQWRDGQIAQCRTAKSKPPTAPAGKPSKWDQTVLARLPDLVRYLDQKTGMHANNIARAQTQWAQRQADEFRKTMALRALPPDTEILKRIDEAAAGFQRRPGTEAPQIPQSALQPRPPQITTFVVEPINDLVEPKSAILIGGVNFRNQPGRNQPGKVHLRYSDFRVEFGPQPKTYDVELMPLKKTWQDSWTDSLIFVRVPDTLPGERFFTNRPGQVVITFADGVSIARDVTIYGGYPFITEVATSSGIAHGCCLTVIREEWRHLTGTESDILQPIEYFRPQPGLPSPHWVQPGDTILIIGRFFGSTPGKARLDLMRAIGGRTTVQLTTIKPEDWSDTKISLRAEDFPTAGYVETQGATLVLETASGSEVWRVNFAFGPRMQAKVVSGYKWFKAWRPGPEEYTSRTPTPNGTAMLVTHTPECGYKSLFIEGGKQEKGADQYSFPLTFRPEEVYEAIQKGVTGAKVIQVNFKHIDPENPYSDLDFFADMMGDLAEAVSGGWIDLITFGVKKFFQAILLSGTGGYHAYVGIGAPYIGGTYVGPAENAVVHWETSCAHEKPIIYVISFIVVGPKQVLDTF